MFDQCLLDAVSENYLVAKYLSAQMVLFPIYDCILLYKLVLFLLAFIDRFDDSAIIHKNF